MHTFIIKCLILVGALCVFGAIANIGNKEMDVFSENGKQPNGSQERTRAFWQSKGWGLTAAFLLGGMALFATAVILGVHYDQ